MLKNLTENQIRQFAGSTIYARGYNYFQEDRVEELSYNPVEEEIYAIVSGSYDSYEVTVRMDQKTIKASCDCPYEGYPCKHVVAVLLAFGKDHKQYEQKAKEQQGAWSAVERALSELPKKELVALILAGARDYPDFQRQLLVRFQPVEKNTLKTLLLQISQAFPPPGSRSFNPEKIAGRLLVILQSVQGAADSLKLAVYWSVSDTILQELNNYGMDDEDLEEVLFGALETLKTMLAENDSLKAEKQRIIGELMDYYLWGNCGVVDTIYETAYGLCSDIGDYRIIIAKLESKGRPRSYNKGLLADLYTQIGDDRAKLRILENSLKYGMDYWDLANYWLEKGDQAKAMAVVREGIEKGQGRKIELYQFLQEQYEKAGDYDGLGRLWQEKQKRGDGDGRIIDDVLYQSLEGYYGETENYPELVKLLESVVKLENLDLKFYQHCRKKLHKEDWPKFEQTILELLEKGIKKEESRRGWLGESRYRQVLAEIYNHRKDNENLARIVQSNWNLLETYENRLLALQPELYLEHYLARVKRLIEARGRDNYQLAVKYLRTVKKIYQELLQQGEQWSNYLAALKLAHKSLRAFQEELGKL